MTRLGLLAVTFVLALAGFTWVGIATLDDEAWSAAKETYRHRFALRGRIEADPLRRPLVVWLGDSTIAPPGIAYPQIAGQRLAARGISFETRVVADPGLDPFDYYFLTGPVLERGPDVLVLIAHLRAFAVHGGGKTYADLVSMIPTSELPRATRLPLYDRGVTIPRLLLARVLRYDAGEQALVGLEAIRWRFYNAGFWNLLGPPSVRPDAQATDRAMRSLEQALRRRYDVPLRRRTPTVRMLGASVEMATRRGVPTLVVASPIPYEWLAEQQLYDAGLFAARFAILRTTVEAAGGTFLDLHERLPRGDFRDNGGHYTAAGAGNVARLVEPVLSEIVATASARARRP